LDVETQDETTNAKITIKGLPEPMGRSWNAELQTQAVNEAQGRIVVFPLHNQPKKQNKNGHGFEGYIHLFSKEKPTPILLIGTCYKGEAKEKEKKEIEKIAQTMGATFIVVELSKLEEKGEAFKVYQRAIQNFVFQVLGEPVIPSEPAEKEKEEKVKEAVKASKGIGSLIKGMTSLFKKSTATAAA